MQEASISTYILYAHKHNDVVTYISLLFLLQLALYPLGVLLDFMSLMMVCASIDHVQCFMHYLPLPPRLHTGVIVTMLFAVLGVSVMVGF